MKKILNLSQLKIMAFVCMIIDHVGLLIGFFPFRLIGRLALPLFSYLVYRGYVHTKNVKKYMLRMFVFAVISEIFFDLFTFGELSFAKQNVMFTLFMSLCLMDAFLSCRRVVSFSLIAVLIAFISELLNFEYGCFGVFMIICFLNLNNYFYLSVFFLSYYLLNFLNGYGIFGVLSLVLIHIVKDEYTKSKFSKIYYVLYPLQFLILYLVRCLM